MHISTNDQMELCEMVSEKISDIAKKQGKNISQEQVFNMLFGGDYCDTFDGILEVL